MVICSSQMLWLCQWFCFALDIGLGSSHSGTHCKNLENCFYLCPGLASMMNLLILFAFVVGCFGFFFLRNGKWSTSHLFWWAMCSFLIIAIYPTCIVLTPGFIFSNYNNFQVHWDKSFPISRGEFWLAVRGSTRGGVVTPHQLDCESAIGNQAVLMCSECFNGFALCQACDMSTKNR